MSSDWKTLIPGAFCFDLAPFGDHPFDEERADEMITEARAAGASNDIIVQACVDYMADQHVDPDYARDQRDKIREYLGG